MTEQVHDDVHRFVTLLYQSGDVFEVRAPKCQERRGSSFTSTVSGYFTFDCLDQAVAAIAPLDDAALAPGIYLTLNPVRPDLLARAANRLRVKARETTADGDIVRRRWMLVDVDPVRPSGVSATDGELEMARERGEAIRAYLTTLDWPAPVVAMSGNGYHLLYRVDLSTDDDGLVQGVLGAIADRFSDDAVSVDRSVFNPARIVKAIGTVARKGDDLRDFPGAGVEDRPHRRSRLVDAPATIACVATEQLKALVAVAAPPSATRANVVAHVASQRFPTTVDGIRAWLEARGVAVKGERRNVSKTLILLERCPVNPEIVSTGGSDIAVLVGDDGKLAYCNKHNRGQHYTWHDLRTAIDPDYSARPVEDTGVDLSGLLTTIDAPQEAGPSSNGDPGPLPPDMLRVPGFVSEVMDFCLETAPYPNPVMAFAGALSLLAFLAGRKVRDSGDNRTNIYLLGLAHSSAGKDWPRKLNTRILHEVGMADCLGERFASGEGIQDALFQRASMLFQTDEIDGMLQSINKARDGRHEAIMSTLLTMYSSSNSVFPMRRKAGKESPGVIDQPNLVIFGTAIPNHYYEALSERMLTNGFFARMIILEAGQRGEGQEPSIRDLPPRVVTTARWWAEHRPGTGNLESWHPVPTIVQHTDEARRSLVETRAEAEHEYAQAESNSDPVGTTVWGRVSEQVRKLSLLHAISVNHESPEIDIAAVRWAASFILHQTRRMLFMAASHAADGEFDALIKRAVVILREWHVKHGPDALVPAWYLRRRLKQRPGDFKDIVVELAERRIAEHVTEPGVTKPKSGYRLL